MRFHRLKCWPSYFAAVLREEKTFELRKSDRDFQERDHLLLEEFDPELDQKTGRYCVVEVTSILRLDEPPRGLIEGFIVMSIRLDEYAKDRITRKGSAML